MDFKAILEGFFPVGTPNASRFGNNATMSGFSPTDGIFSALIPLLGSRNPLIHILTFLYQLIGQRTGLDPGTLITVFGFLWAANKVYKQLYSALYSFVSTYYMAEIHLKSEDDTFDHMIKWLAGQPGMVNSRSLMAETLSKTAWEDEDIGDIVATKISAEGEGVYLNFSNQEAKAPPRFVPSLGEHGFWHKGTYFRLRRKQQQFLEESSSGAMMTSKEDLVVSCFGRSPDPIKALLQTAKENYYNNHFARTMIKRPYSQGMRRYGGRGSWQQVANRPVRPMRTVVLDASQKMQLLADVNEYLSPSAAKWYANRGIPLRRGYLFHGPPGTGKTSLSFALAGVFGLDIHVISLLEPTLSEDDLANLFNSLPRRCVVLLEDIDTAGLSRPEDEEMAGDDAASAETKLINGDTSKAVSKGHAKTQEKKPEANDWKVSDLARELRRQGNRDDDRKGISLSGLLNAIDGVASHEGRVLIMTTNHPEKLDEALIRPGRVDLQVGFTNATQEQARELFVRMYEGDPRRATTEQDAPTKGNGHANGTASEKPAQNGSAQANAELLDELSLHIPIKELQSIARRFADKIPNGQFSPAEIQGFLLKRKKHPMQALDDADKWVEAMVKLKASKTKVMEVQ